MQYLDIDPKDCDVLIKDLQTTRSFRHFGYGSLIGDPSSETDAQYGGAVEAWEKGAFCKDRSFRGKWNSLGITMGAIPNKDAPPLQGVINEIQMQAGDSFAQRVLENIKDFALRETGLNPIYKYAIVDVDTPKKGTVKALICMADNQNPLYLGADKKQLSLEQKAAVIATSIGDRNKDGSFISNPRHTGMAYWRDHVYCCRLGGYEPDPKIKRLVELAEKYRADLKTADPKRYNRLIYIESKQKTDTMPIGVTYATPVYDAAQVRPPMNSRSVRVLAQTARSAAKLHTDPLDKESIAQIKNNITALRADLSL